jgi:hypothetical protein
VNPQPARRRALRAAALAALAALVAAAPAPVAQAKKPKKAVNVRVMTRNLYLGADLLPLFAPAPSDATDLAERVGVTWQEVQATDFDARVKVLAEEVVRRKPDLIGLQEAAWWRRDTAGAPDGEATPAEEVVYDFSEQLRAELAARGLRYKVAVSQTEVDIETPLDPVDDGNPGNELDIRMTIRDVILVRRSDRLSITGRQSGHYDATLPIALELGPDPDHAIEVVRGFTAVDVKKATDRRSRPQRFRFVNTHLEAFLPAPRTAQAGELVAPGSVTDTPKRVVLVGDLNSDPAAGGDEAAAYDTVVGAGFRDVGVASNTFGHDADLLNPPPAEFTQRIDHVLVKGRGIRGLGASLVGTDSALRTPAGLWPSDHGGVVTRLKLKR